MRYHCPHKFDGKFTCGEAGTCNLPVATLEGARALKIECDKLVAKLETGAADVAFLLSGSDTATQLSKYRKASAKHAATIARGAADGAAGGAAGKADNEDM